MQPSGRPAERTLPDRPQGVVTAGRLPGGGQGRKDATAGCPTRRCSGRRPDGICRAVIECREATAAPWLLATVLRGPDYATARAAWEKPMAFISHDSRDKTSSRVRRNWAHKARLSSLVQRVLFSGSAHHYGSRSSAACVNARSAFSFSRQIFYRTPGGLELSSTQSLHAR